MTAHNRDSWGGDYTGAHDAGRDYGMGVAAGHGRGDAAGGAYVPGAVAEPFINGANGDEYGRGRGHGCTDGMGTSAGTGGVIIRE